ncbi:MAG: hypothetical protein GC191_05525 [Azospirillum sp.]|nr:hypothetical protein [Azospirillum sp.]
MTRPLPPRVLVIAAVLMAGATGAAWSREEPDATPVVTLTEPEARGEILRPARSPRTARPGRALESLPRPGVKPPVPAAAPHETAPHETAGKPFIHHEPHGASPVEMAHGQEHGEVHGGEHGEAHSGGHGEKAGSMTDDATTAVEMIAEVAESHLAVDAIQMLKGGGRFTHMFQAFDHGDTTTAVALGIGLVAEGAIVGWLLASTGIGGLVMSEWAGEIALGLVGTAAMAKAANFAGEKIEEVAHGTLSRHQQRYAQAETGKPRH